MNPGVPWDLVIFSYMSFSLGDVTSTTFKVGQLSNLHFLCFQSTSLPAPIFLDLPRTPWFQQRQSWIHYLDSQAYIIPRNTAICLNISSTALWPVPSSSFSDMVVRRKVPGISGKEDRINGLGRSYTICLMPRKLIKKYSISYIISEEMEWDKVSRKLIRLCYMGEHRISQKHCRQSTHSLGTDNYIPI